MNGNDNETRTRRRTSRTITTSLAGLAVLLVLSTAAWRDISAKGVNPPAAAPAAQAASPAPVAQVPAAPPTVDSYANVVEKVAPSVVTIEAERKAKAEPAGLPDDPFFRQFFFGNQMPQQTQPRVVPERDLGSGVIVGSNGYVLTNDHVVHGAESVRVTLSDGHTYDAKIVGTDPPSDLALLKIDATSLPAAALGNSDQVRVGDVALAIGDPLGIGQTVTMGIISAKGRQTTIGDGSYEDFLQTDAPINKGNSGGPLVNTEGQVIGINSQILSPSGGSIGIGFAIPSNMAKNVMAQLKTDGVVKRAELGVYVQPVTSDIAANLGLSQVQGAIVSNVNKGGAAEKAGVERGDVILKFDGQPVKDPNSLKNRIAEQQPDTKATLTVLRNGHEQELHATLGEAQSAGSVNGNGEGGSGNGKFGMTVQPLTPDIARQIQVDPATRGVVVSDVDPFGKAANAGLQQGDVIEQVNGETVTTVSQLRSALERSGSRPALLLVDRAGNTFYVTLRAA